MVLGAGLYWLYGPGIDWGYTGDMWNGRGEWGSNRNHMGIKWGSNGDQMDE